MPLLKVIGVKPEEICKISERTIDEIVDIIKCPRDYCIIECIQSVVIKDVKISESAPFVEIAWFDRGQFKTG